jgi:DNA-binding MarR family transcriptional regulator
MSKSEVKTIAGEIVRVLPRIMRTIMAERDCYPMSPAHFRLLNILDHHACNLSELALRQSVSLPTMSNSISVLVVRGWVNRVPSPDDRRQVVLEITPDGHAVLGEIKVQAEARVADLLGQLAADELKALAAGIAILERALSPSMSAKVSNDPQDKSKKSRER